MPHVACLNAVEPRTAAAASFSCTPRKRSARGERDNRFARRKNAIAISSCGQLENRMISSIVSASYARKSSKDRERTQGEAAGDRGEAGGEKAGGEMFGRLLLTTEHSPLFLLQLLENMISICTAEY